VADPTIAISLAGAVGLAPSVTVLALRRLDAQRWSAGLRNYRLSVPSGCEPSSIESFLAGLTGLLPAKWERPLSVRGIGLEIVATDTGIRHELLVPDIQEDIVLGQLRTCLPSARVEVDPDHQTFSPTLAGELATARPHRQLQVDHPEIVATAILGALQPVGPDEVACIQLLVLPRAPLAVPPTNESWPDFLSGFTTSADRRKSEPSKEAREKYLHPLFAVSIRLAVATNSPARDRQLLARLTAAFHAANSANAILRRRRVSPKQSARDFRTRRPPTVVPSCLLNARELTGLLALPPVGSMLTGLTLGGSRLLPASADIPSRGCVIADSNYSGAARPLALSVVAATHHVQIVGPPGTGKSSLMTNMAIQDMEAGYGVIVIDPNSDLASDLIDRIPRARQRDVTIVDPLDHRPVGINVLQGVGGDAELAAEQVFSTIRKLNPDSWGPQLADILRAGLHTLAQTPGATLVDLPRLLTDQTFAAQVIGGLDDPLGLGAWWSFWHALSDADRNQRLSSVLNKSRPWVVRPTLRHVLGQSHPLLDFDEVLAEQRILIVPLSAGELGDDVASLLGAITLAKIFQAAMRRVRVPRSERTPIRLYVDEAQVLGKLPTPLADMFAMCRKLSVGIVAGHQSLGQFDAELREAILSAARSRIIFQTGASDAARFSRDLAPYVTAEDLKGLAPYEIVASLSTGERVAPPATGRTRPVPPPNGDGERVRELSRQRWGRDRDEVEAELRQRQERPTGSGPIGRQRRSS